MKEQALLLAKTSAILSSSSKRSDAKSKCMIKIGLRTVLNSLNQMRNRLVDGENTAMISQKVKSQETNVKLTKTPANQFYSIITQ